MRPQEDTLLKENNVANETNNNGANKAKKIMAATGAAVVTGAAGAYAYANHTGEKPEEVVEKAVVEKQEETVTPKPEQKEKVQEVQEKKELETVKQERTEESIDTTTATNSTTSDNHQTSNEQEDALSGIDVKIESIETRTNAEGETRHYATGTVNGHQAIFSDDGNGNVQAAAVDLNDNGKIDDNEIADMTGDNVTMGNLADHLSSGEEHVASTPVNSETPEVKVIAVQTDVNLGEDTVNIATVTINDNPVVFVDTNQDGEVNAIVSDDNRNGDIEDNEIHDVSNNHIPMPTQTDVEPSTIAQTDDIPDYSNDADISSYEII